MLQLAVLLLTLQCEVCYSLLTMDDEKLIEYVCDFEEIYNLAHPQYMNTTLKDKKWGQIAIKLEQPAVACKTRWNNIRDNFRKSLKKRVTINGQPATKFKKYKYEDQLSFLIPFIKERESLNYLGSVEQATGDENYNSDSEENDDTEEKNINQTRKTRSKFMEFENHAGSSHQSTDDNVITENVVSTCSLQFNKRKNKPVESTRSTFKTPETPPATSQQSVHPVDAFLAGIAPTLKSLNPYHLNIAKSKIFSSVQEIEMAQIMHMQERYEAPPKTMLSSPSPCLSPVPLIPSPSPI